MIRILKALIFNRSFLFGLIISVGVFSKYIFGADNLLEQAASILTRVFIGVDVDFSPDEPNQCTK